MRKQLLIISILLLIQSCHSIRDSQEEISAERKLFQSKCRACHSLPKPSSRTDWEWQKALEEHKDRIELNSQDYQVILEFLQSGN